MRHHEVGLRGNRLSRDFRRERETGHHLADGAGRIAHEQPDIVPVLGEVRWRKSFEESNQVVDGRRGNAHSTDLQEVFEPNRSGRWETGSRCQPPARSDPGQVVRPRL